jgi:hypothetical protein
MKKRPPLLLILIVGSYLLLELVTLIGHPDAPTSVRFVLAAILGFFMIRGSAAAIFIWAALCVIAAIYGMAWAFQSSQTDTKTAVYAFILGAIALAEALYLIVSRPMRAYIKKA